MAAARAEFSRRTVHQVHGAKLAAAEGRRRGPLAGVARRVTWDIEMPFNCWTG
jgi:hypothetical protein